MNSRGSKIDVNMEERDQRILDYLPLVHYVVGRLCIDLPPSFDRDDLCSLGVIGLLHAASTFDPSRGVAFKTHAYIHIRGAILDELRKMDFLPRTRREKIRQIDSAIGELQQELGRKPTPEELSKFLGMDQKAVDEMLLSSRTANLLSLNDTESGPGLGVAGKLSDNPMEMAQREEAKKVLATAIEGLPEAEKQVVVLYYSEGLLLREIGEVLGVTESRVSQIHSRALFRLNKALAPVLEGL